MAKFDPKKVYQSIKKGGGKYKEEVHCPMILEVMNNEGTMTAFCKKAMISDALFSKWTHKYPLFRECYQLGKMISRANWEEEGEIGAQDKDFNMEHWKAKGAFRYGYGKTNRVTVEINPDKNPYLQYKELVVQANNGDFTATELKQLMESINIGIRAYESFELQGELNELKKDLDKMRNINGQNSVPIAYLAKTD